ncbi:MAG: hypothetical protein D6826_07780 [Alphaproteobacteria bacterium]|nr:MAG: hypothetical protein D6826_07780 [Alphaproteobacteria bacterium]
MTEQPQAFAEARILMTFPSYVWVHDLKPEDSTAINTVILPKIAEIRSACETPAAKSGGRIWQSHHDLHHLPEFRRLVAFFRRAGASVLDFLKVDYSDFAITGCWANVHPPGTSHRPHIHPNNFLSGVYYAQAPHATDGLILHDPRPQAHLLSPRVKKLTEPTASEIRIDAHPGRLIVFPAWLEHSVAPTEAEGERISVSFNIMLNHFTEEHSMPRWSKKPAT